MYCLPRQWSTKCSRTGSLVRLCALPSTLCALVHQISGAEWDSYIEFLHICVFHATHFRPRVSRDLVRREMNELDDAGWGHVHHAAYRGFVKSVERFVNAHTDLLELETGDGLRSTPLMLAVMSDNIDTVKSLVELGANIAARNAQDDGIVELCAFKQHVTILEYLIALNHEKLPVWKQLVQFLLSEVDEEAEATAKTIGIMTQGCNGELHPKWRDAFDNGVVTTGIKVLKSSIGDSAKSEVMRLLLNLTPANEACQQAVSCGCLPTVIKQLKSPHLQLVQLSARLLTQMCIVNAYADDAVQNNAVPALAKLLSTVTDPEVLIDVVEAIGSIAHNHPNHQDTVGSTNGLITSIVELFNGCGHRDLQLALTKSITCIAQSHTANQSSLIDAGVVSHIIALTRAKHQEVQLSAVDAIHRIAECNPVTSRAFLRERAVTSLLPLLRRGRQQAVQERSATAVWALAGDDVDEKHNIAEAMGVSLLVEFMNSLSERLHYIGSECLGGLAQGPSGKQKVIAKASGIPPLVRLLRSDKEHIVLSVTRTLRYLCVGVGYVPITDNQADVALHRGIRFLVALMAHSNNQLIQVEAAHTLGCIALGNSETLAEMLDNGDFSYTSIIQWMYSRDENVRIIAGSALAAFAYNNLSNQRDIIQNGQVLFSCLEGFLLCKDEHRRCLAAFQVVVLAQIIPDEEQAVSSAVGIKLLVDLLTKHNSHLTLALAADCIARLAHTRAGVPSAFVAIDAIPLLSKLLRHKTENVRGSSAIALGYLSYDHKARRQLLNCCRKDPYLMKVLTHYTANGKLAPEFSEGWKHYQQIGLPPITADSVTTAIEERINTHDDETRHVADTSLDETREDSALTIQISLHPPSEPDVQERMSEEARMSHASTAMSNRSIDAPSSAGRLIASPPPDSSTVVA